MRIACCLALVALAACAAPADARVGRVVLAFLPAERDRGLLEELAGSGFAVGVTSPSAGGETAAQTFLDIGQGARVSTRVYDAPVPELELRRDGRLTGWDGAVRRADDAPGEIVPGLLGGSIRAAGRRTAYVGVGGLPHPEAAAAADRAGRVATVSLGPATTFRARLERLLADHALVVARLPAGSGTAPLPALEPEVLVIVVRAPARGRASLLPAAAAPLGRGGLITSRTTRRPGMVAVTDYAPTILEALGIAVPEEVQGRAIEATAGSWEDAESLAERLAHVKSRRGAALLAALAAWAVAAAALAAAGRWRRGLRLGLLTALWLPALALGTGALDPAQGVEAAVLALGAVGLALGTDHLVRWPRAPFVPAAVVVGAHAADLAAGSPLIVRSLAGPNPAFGARFYGVGNELEAIIAVSVLLGAGAFLAGRRGREVQLGFGAACVVVALFVGAGRLGADVGGVVTLAAGGAAAILASRPGGVTARGVAVAVAVPALAVAVLALVDIATGGDAHLTRSVLDADSPREVLEIAERRLEIAWESLRSGTTPVSVGVFAGLLAWGIVRRRRLLAPLAGDRAFAAGLWGALAATIVGALSNDSGPTIFLIGAAVLVLTAGYLAGKPPARALP